MSAIYPQVLWALAINASLDPMETHLTIKRYGPPNKQDQLPKGTICVVENVNFPREIWEQKSEDSENPVWVLKHAPL
jgi:hypothetical protein